MFFLINKTIIFVDSSFKKHKSINPRRHRGGDDAPPFGFSENTSPTDRPIVAKLGIGTYPLNYFTPSLKILRPYLL